MKLHVSLKSKVMLVMNHDSGFIIGIAHVFVKILIEHTPKNHLEKHPSTQNNPLVVLCDEYRSTSKYQVKKETVNEFQTTLKFARLFIS